MFYRATVSCGKALVCMGVLLFFSGATRADTASVARAKTLISAEAQVIATAMHPTAKYLKKYTLDTVSMLKGGGFRLTYTFYYRSTVWKRPLTSTIAFYFDADGDFDFSSPSGTSGVVPPFSASNMALGWVRKKLRADVELKNDPATLRALERASARELLEWYLEYQQSNQVEDD